MAEGFDAVVVGAGVSGLTTACELARGGMRVVVLEQHSVPGGLMQRFRRRGIPILPGRFDRTEKTVPDLIIGSSFAGSLHVSKSVGHG